jgi:probable F420-dependent oxidoreductase
VRVGVTVFLTDRTIDPASLARAAEERGFASLFFPEHTHIPVREAEPPALVEGVSPDDYRRSLDPLVALAVAASVTRTIRLGTGVTLVAQHDPIVLAKQLATLDHISGGRVVLGVGYGWNRSEAADHGVDPETPRGVAREKLACMQALWRMDEASYAGRYVTLGPSFAWPKPVQQPRIRTLFGGAPSAALFATIAELADGWLPIGGAGVAAALPDLRAAAEKAGRNPASITVVPFGTVPSDAKLAYFEQAGIEEVVLRVPAAGADEVERVLDAYARYV